VTDRTRIAVKPLDRTPFGAQVEMGIEVHDLAPADATALREALARHQLLVFPMELDDDEHVRLVSMFGRVLPQGPRIVVNDRPEGPFPTVTFVSNVKPGGGLGTFALAFHHDLAHVPTPLSGLSLYAVDVEPGQAGTRFASGRVAYERLTDRERRELEGLQGLFVGNYTTTTADVERGRDGLRRLDPTWPRVVHPVIVPHPSTGERCVYVNEMQVAEIVGLDHEVGDRMLERLFTVLYDPANVYEHEWHNGELVVWDNLTVQHARRSVTERVPRTLRRVVFGERAPWEQWPWSITERRFDDPVVPR
jgi:taurine dioxygenase